MISRSASLSMAEHPYLQEIKLDISGDGIETPQISLKRGR
jgi:hypothetical protein